MAVSVAAVTVSVVLPLTLSNVAIIVEVPVALAVARPAVDMLATVVLALVQLTLDVIVLVELSEYVPVAANCKASPDGKVGVAGVTVIVSSVGEVTVRSMVSLRPLLVALMVTEPVATPTTRPCVVTVATEGLRLAHMVALSVVRVALLLSEYVPMSVS